MHPVPAPTGLQSQIRNPQSAIARWVAWLLAGAAVAALAPIAVGIVLHWQTYQSFPFQLDAEEGFILNQALTLARGGSIYAAIAHPPFLVANYPPFFPWVYSLATGARATLESLATGRLLVEGAALLAALGLAAIAALRTRRGLPALLAGLLFFSSYEVAHWSAFVRVDFPALALTVAGLGVFLTVRPRWGAALAAVLFVAAGFTRQTAILAPAACAASLLINDRRRLAWFLVPYLGLGGLLFGWFEARTGGEFYRHLVTYNRNRMDWTALARVMKNEVWFFYHWWIVAMAWGSVYCLLNKARSAKTGSAGVHARNTPDETNPVAPSTQNPLTGSADALVRNLPHTRYTLSLYLILAALSLISYGKVGAAPNYVLEPLAAAALWSAELLGRLMDLQFNPQSAIRNPHLKRVALWGFCALLAAHGAQMGLRARQFPWSADPRTQDRAAGRELLGLLREAPGEVFCEDPVYTLLAGKAVLHQPFIMAQLAREGRWDERPLLELIRARRFALFVAGEDLGTGPVRDYERYTPAMAEALRQGYTTLGAVTLPGLYKTYYVWKPK